MTDAELADVLAISLRALRTENTRLLDMLVRIGKRARSNGNRTFDDCLRDLGWIDDECRLLVRESSVCEVCDEDCLSNCRACTLSGEPNPEAFSRDELVTALVLEVRIKDALNERMENGQST